MRKKGFTLIELLAVIVILAIIALIATPIILGIIDDAKKEGNELSIEMYGKAVKNAVAAYELKYKRTPTSFNQLTIEYDGNKVECETQKLYEDGSFYLAKCKVNDVLVENYTYGTKLGECTLNDKDSSNGASLSDEITCGGEQFYVMSADTETVTMLAKNPLSSAYPYKQAESTSEILYTQIFESSAEFEASMERDTNLVNPYLTHYKNYLSGLGYNANVRLITMDDWVSFGCTNTLYKGCSSVPSWVLSNGYRYRYYSSDYILDNPSRYFEYATDFDYAYYYLFGDDSLVTIDEYRNLYWAIAIRPVVTMPISNIG